MKTSRSILLAILAMSSATSASSVKTNEEAIILSPSRIINGSVSIPGDFPYFVAMGGCGGALIAPDIVLFAGHCRNPTNRQLNIGAYERDSLANGAQERFCDIWIRDPKYRRGSDFALCTLNEAVEIDTSLVTIELNEDDNVPLHGEDLIVMGLGLTNRSDFGSSIELKSRGIIVTND